MRSRSPITGFQGAIMSALRQGKTFLSSDHEFICLCYEEALKRLLDAEYGNWHEGGYFVEIFDCTLDEFDAILCAAKVTQEKTAHQLTLWDARQLEAA